MTAVHSTCPYCGVGCGVIAGGEAVRGDPAHPSNRGRLCSKGAALSRTLDDSFRLTEPLLGGVPAGWDSALDHIAGRFADTIARHGPDSVAFYVSGQFLTEDYYVANKLMKGFIGSANIDSNSRLCMASTVAGHVRAFGEDVVPGTYDDWEQADLVVLVGSNTAWCHPVLHQRLQAARAARGTKVVVLDPRRTATAEAADLHLPLAPDSDVAAFNGLLVHLAGSGALDDAWIGRHATGLADALAAARADAPCLDAVAARCGVDPEALETFYAWFAATEHSVTAFSQGVNQSTGGTDKVNAIINVHLATGRIGRPGMGPFSLTGQPNAMGGREVGALANQLAAHLRFDHAEDRAVLRDFWQAPNLATTPGLKAIELFEAVADGRVKAIWIAATNPVASMPRAGRVRQALADCPFVVVSDCWPTDTTALADVVLPAAGWGEKDGTVTSSERRISRQRPFRAAPGLARPDWWAFAQVARRLGWADHFAWDGPAAIFREHAALSARANDGCRLFDIGALAGLDDAAYDALRSVRWPLPAGAAGEGGRLFALGGFPTADGRARLVPVRAPEPRPDGAFVLNTGRVRDQWHSMTRTGRVPELAAHTPEPLLSIHPGDAARLGLADGALARVETPEGAVVLRVGTTHAQRRGEVFAPMHWSGTFASHGTVARATGAGCDPLSGQPGLKSTPARVAPLPAHFEGLLLRRIPGTAPDGVHWVRIPLPAGELFRLAGLDAQPEGDALARLLGAPAGAEIIEMADPGRLTFRRAALLGGELHAILALARTRAALPSEAALADLLGRRVVPTTRPRLLAGIATAPAEGPRICACLGVSEAAIRHAIVTHRLHSIAELGAMLGAGTNCGSCVPELERILRDVREPAL
ncbi:Nitrate reductase [Rhodovastum atsumiense]|uniref:Molybdopterin-dependent oxidoreductase n=1 Tax=Rhodovastum atsumiense TaxID=504468 RepID=A0A5M6IQI3_9PROT|nr:nitrate reductase [Rhodovastum atsumiense]KAA5610530.1 molybdopterin-dependent oxidoreductase [Rhodovastum atsumiense]CAH2605025.1 Nitrate reductase [Rhodovastum atsumiense]